MKCIPFQYDSQYINTVQNHNIAMESDRQLAATNEANRATRIKMALTVLSGPLVFKVLLQETSPCPQLSPRHNRILFPSHLTGGGVTTPDWPLIDQMVCCTAVAIENQPVCAHVCVCVF